MATVFTINGVVIARAAARLVLNGFTCSMDGPDTAEFTEVASVLPGTYRQGQSVTITVDGTLRFSGVIASLHPSGTGSGPIDIGYRCLGLSWLASLIPITAADGTGRMAFNLPSTDDDYIPSLSGLSIGAILKRLYDQHAPQLLAYGITGYSPTELSALTVVPPEPIVITGKLWTNVVELLAEWCNKYGAWIDASGMIHHPNLLTLPTSTLTIDSDPITVGPISEDFSECFTQVVVRGGAWIEGAYLSLADATIAPRWTAAQQAAWTYSDFAQPRGAYELGTISAMSSTTLAVTATSPASITYAANYWSTINAEVWAYTTSGSAVATIGFTESRRIIANTAPSSGSYTLTVDTPFANSGYAKYSIRGLAAAQSLTWRAFDVVPTYVGWHMVKRFSRSEPWSPTNGVVVQTGAPQALICFTQGGVYIEWPMTFTVVPSDGAVTCTTAATCTATISGGSVSGFSGLSGGAGYPASSSSIPVTLSGGGGSGALAHAASNSSGVITSVTLDAGGTGYTSSPRVTIGSTPGYIVFDQPICAAYSSQAALNAGGSAIAAPTDVKLLVPYSLGALTATAPAGGGYAGTAASVNGVQRTLTIDYPTWNDARNAAAMATLAAEKLDTLKNTVIEGSIDYGGKYAPALQLGRALNLAGNGFTTGYESIAAPIRTCGLDYSPRGGPNQWTTRIGYSTRMRPFGGDRLYVHPSWASAAAPTGGAAEGTGGYWSPSPLAFTRPTDFGADLAGGMDGKGEPGWGDLDSLDGRGGGSPRRRESAADRSDRIAEANRQRHKVEADQRENARRSAEREKGRPGVDPSEANTLAMLSEIERGNGPVRARQVQADQRENARLAAERERQQIRARNAAKADRKRQDEDLRKADPNGVDDYLGRLGRTGDQ